MNVSHITYHKNYVSYFFINILITVPEEFQYDPVSKSYGDPTRRPEVKSSTIEFIAPSEYMVCFVL